MKHIFIVNPYAGRLNFANNLRDQLEQIEGLEYYLFNSRYSGNETELAEKMTNFFPDEKIRIYACGGSGTFRNVLQGVGENPNVELAFYPCGQTNDFLKVFKEEDQWRFFDIEELIDGEVLVLDSMLTNHGRAMNTVSCGLDARVLSLIEKQHPVRTMGIQLQYFVHVLQSSFGMRKNSYRVRADGLNFDGFYDEIVVGNGSWLGGSLCMPKGFYPNDGAEGYILAPSKGKFAFIRLLANLQSQDDRFVSEHARVGQCKKMILAKDDKGEMVVNLDGEMIRASGEWTIELRPDSVQFVVPRGVTLE